MRIEQLRIDGGADDATAFSAFETVADRLRASAGYIRDHWQQGVLCDDNGFVCAVGGLLGLREYADDQHEGMTLLALDPVADQAVTLVADYLIENVPRFARPADGLRVALVEQWNDDCARDGAEVAEVFEKVAARWEENGNA